MGEIALIDKGKLVLAQAGGLGLQGLKPFAEDLYLTETYVAGTTIGVAGDLLAITPGSRLKLFRDKNNRYDANSIVIKDKNGSRIGYVPTTKNEILARLLEGGRALYANVIKTKTLSSGVKRIDIKVYMEG